jgi:hypothetical protein
MFPIASYTVPSNTSSIISFTNLPQTFTHLQVRYFVRNQYSGSIAYPNMYTNNDGASNHWTNHSLYGNGSSAASTNNTNNVFSLVTGPASGSLSNVWACYIIDILDYTNTNKYKVFRQIGGWDDNNTSGSNAQVSISSGANYSILGAITELDFGCYNPNGSGLAAGSRIDIYGIQTSNATGA